MPVARRVAARAVFDEHALDALAGNVRQLVLVDEGHLGVLRIGASARTLPNGRVATSSEQRMRFTEPSPSVGGCRIRLLPVSGGDIRRNRCDPGALRTSARASAPRPGRPRYGAPGPASAPSG